MGGWVHVWVRHDFLQGASWWQHELCFEQQVHMVCGWVSGLVCVCVCVCVWGGGGGGGGGEGEGAGESVWHDFL